MVLDCRRRGCANVMCDRLSYEHGYICYDCYEELLYHGPTANISKFMGSPKQNMRASRARFDAEFPAT